MIAKYVANMVTIPGDSPIFNNPKEYGLNYEDVTFKAKDGVTLSGWLIKGGTDKIIIQSHFASQCSRSGYSPKGKGFVTLWDEDISFLNQAKYLVDAGYSVLVYDFRNHGNSDKGTNQYITGGPEESKDVIAAVDFISNHPVYKDAKIGLLSICMGTNSTSFAFGVEGGLENYENIKAFISVQPLSFGDFLREMGVPAFLVKRANSVNLKRGGKDFDASPLKHLKSVHVPTMVIQNTNDPWTHRESVEAYYEALPIEKEMVWLDLSKKRAAAYDWVGKNPKEVLGWFSKHMN